MRQIRLRIDDENYVRLLKAKEQKYSSINALINSALLEYFNKESDKKLLKENSDCGFAHTIQIKASAAEFDLLKEEPKLMVLKQQQKS